MRLIISQICGRNTAVKSRVSLLFATANLFFPSLLNFCFFIFFISTNSRICLAFFHSTSTLLAGISEVCFNETVPHRGYADGRIFCIIYLKKLCEIVMCQSHFTPRWMASRYKYLPYMLFKFIVFKIVTLLILDANLNDRFYWYGYLY